MQKKITIYSTPTCHYCHLAKDFFKENNLSYEEMDVSINMQARSEMIEKSGQMGVPVIIIDNDLLIGFNKPKLASLLGI